MARIRKNVFVTTKFDRDACLTENRGERQRVKERKGKDQKRNEDSGEDDRGVDVP